MGFDYGDKILKNISRTLKNCQKALNLELVSRLDGDVFALITGKIEDETQLQHLVNSINDSIALLWEDGHINHYINISTGASVYPEHGSTDQELMINANSAMHESKNKEGNSFTIYKEEISVKYLELVTIENNLRKAILQNELVLFYQPKVRLEDGKIIGVEALIRWEHPEQGMIPPFKFIPVAENTGVIRDITRWVIKEAFEQISRWYSEGFAVTVSINISAEDLKQKDFVKQVSGYLDEANINPDLVEFEITESVFLENIAEALRAVKELRELGIKISLDDFGTGYSSLSYLRDLPIDSIKLDKSFLRDLTDVKNLSIIESIIDLSHRLGLEVIAEGIETLQDAENLRKVKCGKGQGYYYYKPMPVEKLDNTLQTI